MARPSSFLLTLFSSLLISSVSAQGYYGQPPPPPPPPPSYGNGNGNGNPGHPGNGNGDGLTTLTIPGGPTITIPGIIVPTPAGGNPPPQGGYPTSQGGGEVTTHRTSTLAVTIQTTLPACAISVSIATYLQVHTVSYVTTETIVQSITSSVCQSPPAPTTCVTGSPVTTGGYTITYVTVHPTPYVANYVPDISWETGGYGHLIGSEEFYFGSDFQAYAEFKCQFQCTGACESWFVAYNTAGDYWKCIQFNALIPGTVLVPPPADAPYVSGVAYNNLCGSKPTLTAPITDVFPTTSKPATSTSSNDGGVTSKSTTPSIPPYNPPTYTPSPPGGYGTSGGPGNPTSSNDGAVTTKTTATQSPYKPPTTSTYKPITTPPPPPYYGDGPPPAVYGNPTTLKTSTKPGNPYDFINLGLLGGEE